MDTYRNIILHLIWLYDDIKDNKNIGDATKSLCIANIETILGEISHCILLDYIDKNCNKDNECSDTCDICAPFECIGCNNKGDLPFA